MTLKGKTFTPADLPRSHRLTPEEATAWADARTERYRIVAMDGEYPVIAEELNERLLRRLGPGVREIATAMLHQLRPDQRAALVLAFDADTGELRNTFFPI